MSNKTLDDELDPRGGTKANKNLEFKDAEINTELNLEKQQIDLKRKTIIIEDEEQQNEDLELDAELGGQSQDQKMILSRNWSEWIQNEEYCLAITGRAFRYLIEQRDTADPKAVKRFKIMLERTQVFARMKPEDKSQLVLELQQSEE